LGRQAAVAREALTVARDFTALCDFIGSRQALPYAWGRDANDCVGFVLGAVEAMTGAVVGPKLKWSSEKEALKAIAKFGSLEAAFDAHFGRIPPALAQRGDIAGVPDETFGIHPGIIEGLTIVGPGEKGNRRIPRRLATVAWSATQVKP
jgi:hypothetical protein